MSDSKPIIKEMESHGFLLEIEDREIISIRSEEDPPEKKICVGDNVTVDYVGWLVPNGTKGVVKQIVEPFSKGHSTDIIRVACEDNKPPHWFKFKELK